MTSAPASSPNSPEDDQILSIFASVRQTIVAERTTISEELFSNVFLPFFNNSPTADPRISMNTWYGIAGGAFNEVNVLDRTGKVLYAVPPVMSNKVVAPISREGGRALSSLLNLAARRDKLIPGTGSALLSEGLKRFDFVVPGADGIMSEYRERWDAINARYTTGKDGATTTETNTEKDDGLGIFDF